MEVIVNESSVIVIYEFYTERIYTADILVDFFDKAHFYNIELVYSVKYQNLMNPHN